MLKKKPLVWLSLLLMLGLVAAACGSDDKSDSTNSTGTTAASASSSIDYSKLTGSISGSGSSFQDAYEEAAIDALSSTGSALKVTYNSVGSGQGKKDFGSNLTDFAGTDSAVKAGDGPADGSYLYVPIVAAPITISYNLSGVSDLQLSADTLAGIFGGTITKWDDAAIKADNPKASLPSKAIVMVHRADGSGTTSNFTAFLQKAAPTKWTLGSSDTVAWPTDSQAGQKNTGVAQIIKSTDGAIGYVDLSDADATQLVYASIKNASGKFVAPTLKGSSEALEYATVNADLTIDPINVTGDEVYPITSPTYILVRTKYSDQAKADAVKGFVTYLVTDAGKQAKDVDFSTLSKELQTKALAQLDKITVG